MTKVFSIFDSKTGAYFAPVFMQSNGAALRAFADAVNDPSSAIAKHPGDYTIFEVGSWDELTCTFTLLPTPTRLAVAIEFVAQK